MGRNFGRNDITYQFQQGLIIGMMAMYCRKIAFAVFENQRQGPLRQIAKTIRQISIYARDNGLWAIAAILPKADFAQQEIAQGIDAIQLSQFHRVYHIA